MRTPREPFRIIRANLGAYLVLNVLVYGVLLAGLAVGLLFPELTASLVTGQEDDGTADLVVSLLGNVWLFALTILAVNVLTVGVLKILLPSLVVPFAGIALLLYKTFESGVILAPVDETMATVLLPHTPTMVIEFQAYILLSLGSYLLGRAWLRPATVSAPNRRQGYVRGLRQFGWLSLPALTLFVIGAVYEAFSLIYLVPRLLMG
ncbi:stage II sporulation protein M [Nocardiopsis sp. Huas11]|uniref:stage II sporulation protein M n=1 Tax=Nocardiopsis sp. Huas11 TaxID=2183912 RepID=UPI000EB499DA|nr:stage II sporulation protein M [Nocardiopsis sp. Huas11]RKS07642.1 stage II sporulation protein M [Nocardiopsis sp. Huas11]